MCTSKPKVPAPTPVIERQPYKAAPSRASLSSGDSETRRRMIAGVATSAQGLMSPASTTKRVLAGGDQQVSPVLGGSGSSAPALVAAPSAPVAPVRAGQTGQSVKPSGGGSDPRAPLAVFPGVVGMAVTAAMAKKRNAALPAGG